MWFARTSFGWICYTAPMDTLFKKLGGTLSLALLAGLAQAKTLESLRRGPAVPLADFSGELVEAHLACTLPPNGTAAFDLRGVKLVYDAKDATLAINGNRERAASAGHRGDRAGRTQSPAGGRHPRFCEPPPLRDILRGGHGHRLPGLLPAVNSWSKLIKRNFIVD